MKLKLKSFKNRPISQIPNIIGTVFVDYYKVMWKVCLLVHSFNNSFLNQLNSKSSSKGIGGKQYDVTYFDFVSLF